MAPKRDDSTPAVQGSFELVGIERTTEEARVARLTIGGTSLGGSLPGPLGSTRVWFRLPAPRSGQRGIPRDSDLQAFIVFPNGERYPTQWELADLSQRIATALIPSGFAPTNWVDFQLEGSFGKARWRLNSLPKVPAALPENGTATATAEGSTLTATVVTSARMPIGYDESVATGASLLLKLTLDPPSPLKGKGVRVIVERFTPEYQYPSDDLGSKVLMAIRPGEGTLKQGLGFPYGDQLKRIGVKGRFEVWDSTREPITIENVRWSWDNLGIGGKKVLRIQGKSISRPDRATILLGGYVPVDFAPPEKRVDPTLRPQYIPSSEATGIEALNIDYSVVDLVPDPQYAGWERRVVAMEKERDYSKSLSLGNVKGFLLQRRVVRTIPFELVVPVQPGNPKDIAEEEKRLAKIAKDRVRDSRGPRPASGSGPIGVKTSVVKE